MDWTLEQVDSQVTVEKCASHDATMLGRQVPPKDSTRPRSCIKHPPRGVNREFNSGCLHTRAIAAGIYVHVQTRVHVHARAI